MKINRDIAIRIDSLRTAGLGYGLIATQLNLKRDTVAKHCQKVDHVKRLPVKEKHFKEKIQGRKQLQIKQYIQFNPTDTLQDIITGCDLDVSTVNFVEIFEKARNAMQCCKEANCHFLCQ